MSPLKSCLFAVLIASASFLAGCKNLITNLTPSKVTQNPSNVYTLAMELDPRISRQAQPASIKATVTVNGQTFPLSKDPSKRNRFFCDYKMPQGSNELKYYYTFSYEMYNESMHPIFKRIESDLFDLKLTNRYVVTLEAQRTLVGTTLGVLGAGFTPSDKVYVGSVEAPTHFASHNSLRFTVPALAAKNKYPVTIKNNSDSLNAGDIYIDASKISCNTSSLSLSPNERTSLTFSIEQPAPQHGLELTITTDIPQSIIMPEAIIPNGSTQTTVALQAGPPAKGFLFITAPGYEETIIPVEISSTSTTPTLPTSSPSTNDDKFLTPEF